MQSINLNIVPDGYKQVLRYSQGDIGREFKINIVGFDIPAGATVKIRATKPSGFGFDESCTFLGNVVTIVTTETMTNENGRFPAELRIENNGVVLGTANFVMWGEKNPHPDGTTDGDSESAIPILTQLVEEIENSNARIQSLTAEATRLEAGADPTAAYDPENNTLELGIPSAELYCTDPEDDGNVIISFS